MEQKGRKERKMTEREYIVRETGFPGMLKKEIVGELVRCKDCKHRDTENGLCEGRGWPMQLVPDDGFATKGRGAKNEESN